MSILLQYMYIGLIFFLLFIKRDLFTTIIKVLNMNIVTYTLKKTHN